MKILVTYQWRSNGRGRQCVGYNDEEDGVAEQQCDLKGNSLSAVWRQKETNDVHHHQEDAGQQQIHGVKEWPSSDHHLWESGSMLGIIRGLEGH